MDKKNIIILGTGFAGFSCLKKLNKKNYNITVISPRNHFLFTPLLPSTTVGTIEFRSIIEPIRNTKEIKFFKANCLNIDAINNIITCEDSRSGEKFNVPFHILILAVGEMSNSYNIVGVKENSYFLRELSDARRIRTRVIECFEKASFPNLTTEQKKNYLRFFVCGGGPTGVEFAAELHDFIEEDVKRKYKELADLTELILIEAESKLLNSFDSKLSEYTMRLFRRHHIIVKTGLSIIKVTKDLLYVNDGTKYNYGILVWTAGNTATNLIKDCDFEKSKRNKIIVDKYFKVIGHDNTYAIGDCCEPEGEMYPVTGQVAASQSDREKTGQPEAGN